MKMSKKEVFLMQFLQGECNNENSATEWAGFYT